MDSGWELPKQQLHKNQDLDSYRKSLVPAKDNRALRALSVFEGDVLIVESELDDIVPHEVIANYLEAVIKPLSLTYRVIHGADHGLTDAAHQHAYTSLLVNWLTEMVFGARTGNTSAEITVSAGNAMPESPPR
jgi:hypothetical protein